MSLRRLVKELKRWQEDPPAGISASPQDNNMMLWNAVISGPEDTPWDGGEPIQSSDVFGYVQIDNSDTNILSNGGTNCSICFSNVPSKYLRRWKDMFGHPARYVSFLCDPNPDVPANSEAAQLFIENKRIYNRKIREIVEESLTRGEQLNQKIERLNQIELKVVEESLTRGEQLNLKTEKSSWFDSVYENLKIKFFDCFKPNRPNAHPKPDRC